MMADPLVAMSVRLWDISWQAGLLAIAAWTLCRVCPHIPAHIRTTIWWLVCAKFLVGLVWMQPVSLRLLPPDAAEALAAGADYAHAVVASWRVASWSTPAAASVTPVASATGTASGAGQIGFGRSMSVPARTTPSSVASALTPAGSWPGRDAFLSALAGFWLCGVLVQLALTWSAWRRTRAIVEESTPASAAITLLADSIGQRLRTGSPRVAVRVSESIDTPRVTGTLTPVILLPTTAGQLSRAELEMTLCHELCHVRRGDLLLGWLPSLAQLLFFFHPCVWLAAREYALAREEACDAAVLRILDAPADAYGALLLRLGITHVQLAPMAVGASSSFRNLKRRLLMLQHTSETARAHAARWWLATAAIALAIIPLRIVAQTSSSSSTSQSTHSVQRLSTRSDRDAWVLLRDRDDNVMMSGRTEDVAEAGRQRASAGQPLLWFRHAGNAYVIRDAETLAAVEALFEPIRVLGEQQGALGEEQGKLGERQGKFGAQQGELGAQMGELSAKLNLLNADQLELTAKQIRNGNVETEALKRQAADIEAQMKKVSDQITALGRSQEQLGRQQEALGREQERFGRQQEALGQKQEDASKRIEQQMRELLERAITRGQAERAR